MQELQPVIRVIVVLLLCILNGHAMIEYRLSVRQTRLCYAAVTIFCIILNSFLVLRYGMSLFRSILLFSLGIPYMGVIVFISKDKFSQTFFNFWLWLNVYAIVTNVALMLANYIFNDISFQFYIILFLFAGYYVLYRRYLKKIHRTFIENLNVNWWVYSFIPFLFCLLIWLINYYSKAFFGNNRQYPLLLVLFALMVVVYTLIIYTFKTTQDSMEKKQLVSSMKEQILLQKKQYEFYQQKEDEGRIYRHDQRFRNTMLLELLNSGDIAGAKAFLNTAQAELQAHTQAPICKNKLINAVLAEYRDKAEMKGLALSLEIEMPQPLICDEAEICVMLSNLLENSLEAAQTYIVVKIKQFNQQLSLNIRNDYTGELKKDANGCYLTTKPNGSGLGLKSVSAILKSNHGILKIDDQNGVFNVFASLQN